MPPTTSPKMPAEVSASCATFFTSKGCCFVVAFASDCMGFPFPADHPPPQRVAVHDVVARLQLLNQRVLICDRIVERRLSDEQSDLHRLRTVRRPRAFAVP